MDKDMSLQPEDLGALFELERDPVFGVGEDGAVVFANPAAAAFFGLAVGDRAGETKRNSWHRM